MAQNKLAALAAMSAQEVAVAIDVPLEQWSGNCFAIATKLTTSGLVPSGSRAVYGHWLGPIAPASSFAARAHLGLTGHGWILTEDDQVIDPTRWVFEAVPAYIYIGGDQSNNIDEVCRTCGHLDDEHEGFWSRCTGGDMAGYDCGECLFEPTVDAVCARDARCYDEGGNTLREQRMRPYPPADPATPTPDNYPPGVAQMVLAQLGYDGAGMSPSQMAWAANLPLPLLSVAAEELYQWLIDKGCAGFIPYDNRLRVLGGSTTAP